MSATPSPVVAPLAWTGERMIPFASDPATEVFHWQRYLFFRPWYAGAKVLDAACGEGYGTHYASLFADWARGIDLSPEAIEHAASRYPEAQFEVADAAAYDYADSGADLILSFETIEHLPDPEAFLRALAASSADLVISTPNRRNHSPGNRLGDPPLNRFHTIEWTPEEFAELVGTTFSGRQVRFLSQMPVWPGRLVEGLHPDAKYTIAVVGDRALPRWPSMGLAMPVLEGASRARNAVIGLTKSYPGDLRIAVVANGSSPDARAELARIAQDAPQVATLVELSENLGFAQGCNAGLAALPGGLDLVGVVNDDVFPSIDCLPQLAAAFLALADHPVPVGMLGPVSNEISGHQQVTIGSYRDLPEMQRRADDWTRSHHSSASEARQLRGVLLLLTSACFRTIGGLDPNFRVGNFEDDDWNLRAFLAGFSLWRVDGAFLHHDGSQTFGELKTPYSHLMERNHDVFLAKWDCPAFEDAFQRDCAPDGVSLYVPLDAVPRASGHRAKIEERIVDLVFEASDMEFAAWVHQWIQQRPREDRKELLELMNRLAA